MRCPDCGGRLRKFKGFKRQVNLPGLCDVNKTYYLCVACRKEFDEIFLKNKEGGNVN